MDTLTKIKAASAPFILAPFFIMAACGRPAGISAQTAEAAPAPVDTTDYTQSVDRAILTLGTGFDSGYTIQDMSFKDQPITLGICKALANDAAQTGSNSSMRSSVTCLNQGRRVGNFLGLHRE
jgi:hypothetical protein